MLCSRDTSYFSGHLPPIIKTPVDFVFKKHGAFSHAFLTKWIDLVKGNLEHQWPLWGTFEIPKLVFLKTKDNLKLGFMDNHNSKISQTEWNAYFDWYFEASKYYQEPILASLQNEISRLTEANKQLKKEKMGSEALCSSSLAPRAQVLPQAPSSPFPSILPTPPPQFPLTWQTYIFPLKISLAHFSLEPSERTCPFKTKISEDPEAKLLLLFFFLIYIFPGLKLHYKPQPKIFTK